MEGIPQARAKVYGNVGGKNVAAEMSAP
jgi:hypothetical protein